MALTCKAFGDIITFTRASSATFVGSNGLIQSATTNTPRFDYDPVPLAAKGLLIEEQRTNLLTYSEDFSNAAWTKTRASVSANATTSPDGTSNADKLVEDTTASNTHYVEQIVTTTAATHGFSCYVKAAERSFVLFWNSTVNYGRVFDVGSGAVSGTVAGVPQANAEITNVGNGWYRCTIYGTCTAASNTFRILTMTNATTFSYTGDGTSGIFIWGAQLEAGSFATSYIPTVASQVTRSADVASVNTLSPWYNATEGTLYGEFDQYSITSPNNQWVAFLSDNTANNYIGSLTNPSSYRALVVSGGATQASIINGAISANTIVKSSLAYKANDFAATSGGAAVITDTSGTVPSVTQMSIGAFNGATFINGHIRRITYYPRRLSNAELQAITA